MAKATAADLLVERLQEWGVEVVFGLPGDGINGIMESLRARKDAIRFVQVRHEESAAFMACAYAKFTGRLGVCLATSGPGGLHLLNGLYDAKLDHQPVVAIVGQSVRAALGGVPRRHGRDRALAGRRRRRRLHQTRCGAPRYLRRRGGGLDSARRWPSIRERVDPSACAPS